MSTLRVVFDTNVFQPGAFDPLERSPFEKLCRSGRIVPIYSHVFLEETLRAYGKENRREDLVNRWLPFIASTAHRLCEDFISIWHEELVRGRGRHANIYMSMTHQKRIFSAIPHIPLDGTWSAWSDTDLERRIDLQKRMNQDLETRAMRQVVIDWRRGEGKASKLNKTIRADVFFANELDISGRDFIHSLINTKNPHEVADRWSRAKDQYPFFSNFVRNMIYISHHAMTKMNERIDLNAQADLDLMTHLLHADILVTNETGFMKTAFDDLWRPSGKVLFSSNEFCNFICNFICKL
jgi:hypothetical protein